MTTNFETRIAMVPDWSSGWNFHAAIGLIYKCEVELDQLVRAKLSFLYLSYNSWTIFSKKNHGQLLDVE